MIEACFFDLDKTVIDEQGRLYDGLSHVLDPQRRNFSMTILTARGYPRFQEAVRENPNLAVTPGMPVALENGARIIDSEGENTIYYHPLQNEERDSVCEYVDRNEPLRYVAFHSKKLLAKTLLWSPDPEEANRLHSAYSHNADVFTSSKDDLFSAIEQHEPCMITCRSYQGHPRDLPIDVKWYSRNSTVNFVPHGVDKGRAAQAIADISGHELGNVLAAGNDSNDIPMLGLEGLGQPVVVGPEITDDEFARLPNRTMRVQNPSHLGSLILERSQP